jgi:hypothetical protein
MTPHRYSLLVALIFCSIFTPVTAGEIKEIYFNYSSNTRGLISYPDKAQATGVIIYNYDEFWDYAKEAGAISRGYDIRRFMQVFNSWGYACIIPINRYRKVDAIKGAIVYAQKDPKIAPNNTHIIGISEGAFLSLYCATLPVNSYTLITPTSVNRSRELSLQSTNRILPKIKTKVLFINATQDEMWRQDHVNELITLLKSHKLNVTYKEYMVTHSWFWDPEQSYMQEIYRFITGKNQTVTTLLK